ncbi:MAG: helix-turn-helix domain-containing protein [Thioploca sp.]|nr:helix-turn-helix domain-containing protein [Thioploca sp.]
MAHPTKTIDDQFAEAETYFDLNKLYKDLASAKGKRLTPTEKAHLRGLLCGHSPAEIADKLNKAKNSVEVDLSSTVYQYIKSLLNKESQDVGNWRDICEWLREAGYEQPFKERQITATLPAQAVVNIEMVKRNKILIDINLRVVAPLPTLPENSQPTNTIDNDE